MMSLVSILLLFISGTQAANFPSGYERGNGGQLVQCDGKSRYGERVLSLDHLEGELFYNLVPAKSFNSLSNENEIIESLLQKLAAINPSRAALYSKWYQQILSNREFTDNLYIQPINDGNVVLLPEGCVAKQAAVFITNDDQSRIRFLFDRQLWEQAPALDRAFLLLHEMIFREARLPENQHLNSMASRYLNSWLFAHADLLTEEQWVEQLKNSKFQAADYHNLRIILTHKNRSGQIQDAPILSYKDSKRIHKAVLANSFSIKINGELFERSCKSSPLSLGYSEYVEFYPSGAPKILVFSDYDLYATPECKLYNGNNKLELDEAGNLIKASKIQTLLFWKFDEN